MVVDLLVAVLIAVGLAGVLIPFLPGTSLVGLSVIGWAWHEGGTSAWLVAAAATALLIAGVVCKYLYPGRRLQASGLGARTFVAAGVLGVVGFFVVPVVGLVLGFVLGIYLDQLLRRGHASAWPATLDALRAIGLGMLIELAAGVLAALVWLTGALTT